MKVVRRTIFDKIDKELIRGGEIIRIELTANEFRDAVDEAFNFGKWHGFTVKQNYEGVMSNYVLEKCDGKFINSYFHYKNHKVIAS